MHTNRVQSKPFIKKGPIDDRQGQLEISLLALFGKPDLKVRRQMLAYFKSKLRSNMGRNRNSYRPGAVLIQHHHPGWETDEDGLD